MILVLGILVGLAISILIVVIEMRLLPPNRPIELLKRELGSILPKDKATILRRPTAAQRANEERTKRAKDLGEEGVLLEDVEI